MKNRAGFYIKSRNCEEAEERLLLGEFIGVEKVRQSVLKAKDIAPGFSGLEWHHNGNYINFYLKDEEDLEKWEVFKNRLESVEATFESKRAAMEYVNTLPIAQDDSQKYTIHVKAGKYGRFCCTDSSYFKSTDEMRVAPNEKIYFEILNMFR